LLPFSVTAQNLQENLNINNSGTSAIANTSGIEQSVQSGASESDPNSIDFPLAGLTFDNWAKLAMSSENYPVTPGDRYALSYVSSYQTSTVQVTVESNYKVNLSIFSTIDAKGMTYPEL